MAELIVSLGERELRRFQIEAVRTSIGRDASCDLVIDNAGVSRQHATVSLEGEAFHVADCGSQNGILVNGEACRKAQLKHGDVVAINKFLIRFSNKDNALPTGLRGEAPEPSDAVLPKNVHRTVHLDQTSAAAMAERAKAEIARQRAELAARGGVSLPPEQAPALAPKIQQPVPPTSRRASGTVVFLGGVLLGAVLIFGILSLAL